MKKNQKKITNGTFWLYGHHSVQAALDNPDRVKIRLILTKDAEKPLNLPKSLPISVINKEDISNLLPKDSVHQGIALEVKPLSPFTIEDIIRLAESEGKSRIVILDGVTDIHNIGAILRSAVAFSASAVIVTDKNAPDECGAMAKSACGALDIIPFIRVTNLARAISLLKENGFWVIGMDGKADMEISKLEVPAKSVIIMGSEGTGMRRLTLESCDFLSKLPISSKMESLNVSVATAITLYELNRKQ